MLYPSPQALPSAQLVPAGFPGRRVLTPTAARMLGSLPPFLHDDPDVRAVMAVYGREAELAQQQLEWLVDQVTPVNVDDAGLRLWERLLRLAGDGDLEQRRAAATNALRALSQEGSGSNWVAALTEEIGGGWAHAEHNPDDASSPPANTVRITVPHSPGSAEFEQTRRAVRARTHAHLEVQVVAGAGFVLDRSALDQEAFAG